MPAYRFCRSDDIALLADALNACYAVHFSEQPKLSVAGFKREIRELSVWSSSCMVACVDGDPIAVVTGAKREHETLIHRIGVRPDFLRQGHARHLLESLGQKFAILGPPRIVAEIPDDLPHVRSLFEVVGYKAEQRFADFSLRVELLPPAAAGEVGPASLDDLLRYGALDFSDSDPTDVSPSDVRPSDFRSWERALPTLQNRKDQLQGLAIASDTRVEAYVLFRDLPECGRREIVSLGAAAPLGDGDTDASVLLEIVIRVACQASSLLVTVPKISSAEISWARLEAMGFRIDRTYTRFASQPGDHSDTEL